MKASVRQRLPQLAANRKAVFALFGLARHLFGYIARDLFGFRTAFWETGTRRTEALQEVRLMRFETLLDQQERGLRPNRRRDRGDRGDVCINLQNLAARISPTFPPCASSRSPE